VEERDRRNELLRPDYRSLKGRELEVGYFGKAASKRPPQQLYIRSVIFFRKTKLGCQQKKWGQGWGSRPEGPRSEVCILGSGLGGLQQGPVVVQFKSCIWPLLANKNLLLWMLSVVHTVHDSIVGGCSSKTGRESGGGRYGFRNIAVIRCLGNVVTPLSGVRDRAPVPYKVLFTFYSGWAFLLGKQTESRTMFSGSQLPRSVNGPGYGPPRS